MQDPKYKLYERCYNWCVSFFWKKVRGEVLMILYPYGIWVGSVYAKRTSSKNAQLLSPPNIFESVPMFYFISF